MRESSYQWLNLKSYGLPHGLGMGGNLETFRVFIPESLESCIARGSCLTYEPGVLLPQSSRGVFEIESLEIWGTGGDELIEKGIKSQELNRNIREDAIQKARKVDKAAFANNSFDQEFLLSKTFAHKVRVADDV